MRERERTYRLGAATGVGARPSSRENGRDPLNDWLDSKQSGHFTRKKAKYPWHIWMDGDEHTITQGVDFTISMRSMIARIRQEAYMRDALVYSDYSLRNGDATTITFRVRVRK